MITISPVNKFTFFTISKCTLIIMTYNNKTTKVAIQQWVAVLRVPQD